MTTIGDIFDIPDGVHQGDFVLRLTEGLKGEQRKQTLEQQTGNTSRGAYLHGSFGSGKSHFMAVLDLILEGDADAETLPPR